MMTTEHHQKSQQPIKSILKRPDQTLETQELRAKTKPTPLLSTKSTKSLKKVAVHTPQEAASKPNEWQGSELLTEIDISTHKFKQLKSTQNLMVPAAEYSAERDPV